MASKALSEDQLSRLRTANIYDAEDLMEFRNLVKGVLMMLPVCAYREELIQKHGACIKVLEDLVRDTIA